MNAPMRHRRRSLSDSFWHQGGFILALTVLSILLAAIALLWIGGVQ